MNSQQEAEALVAALDRRVAELLAGGLDDEDFEAATAHLNRETEND